MDNSSVSKQMRVLVLLGALSIYGREIGTIRVAQALKDAGINVHFLISRNWGDEIERELRMRGLSYSRAHFGVALGRSLFVSWMNILYFFNGFFLFPFELLSQVARFKPTHILLGNLTEFIYALPALVLLKTPVIYRLGDKVPAGIYGLIFRVIVKSRVNQFPCISEYIRADALTNGIPDRKLQVIYNIAPQQCSIKSAGVYRKHGQDTVITYIGQMHEYKGVGLFVEAAIDYIQNRQDVVFFLAGDYTYRNQFALNQIRKVKDLNLDNRIIFLGYVNDPLLLLRDSDIHCAPSFCEEALGNVVLEAKACGVPSVVFPDGGLPEMIRHKVDGFICRDKTKEALKEGISFFLDNSQALDSAKQQARISRDNFDGRTISKQWLKLLA